MLRKLKIISGAAFSIEVEGATMSGEDQMGDAGTYTWTAKRKK